MLTFHFSLGPDWDSRLIAYAGAGGFSHVDTIMPSGAYLGARSDVIKDPAVGTSIPSGVQLRPPGYEKWSAWATMVLPTSDEQDQIYYAFLNAQLGKPYDRLAIFAFAIERNWRDEGAWYCSELNCSGLEQCSFVPNLYMPVNKVAPTMLAVVCSAVGGKVISQG